MSVETLNIIINYDWIYTIFAAIAVCSTIIIIFIILLENRNPVKSLSWVTVLLLLPVVGLILYLFFGRSIKNKRMISRRNRRKLKRSSPRSNVDPRALSLESGSIQQIILGRSLAGAQFYPGNTVNVFFNGSDKFRAFKEDLRRAQSSINIQYYIIENDGIGREIADILIDKARNGVKVRLIYDHVGSLHVPTRFFQPAEETCGTTSVLSMFPHVSSAG